MARTATSTGRVWLVLPDPLSTRIFFDCGIAERLLAELGPELELVSLMPPDEASEWVGRLEGASVSYREDLIPWRVGLVEKVRRRLDLWLDRRIGFYPLAIRLNLRHGFHRERMRRGHPNYALDLARIGPLARAAAVDNWMLRWHYGTRRYVSTALLERMRRDCRAVVFSNLQTQPAVPFLLAARRLGLATVGYVASWDHTVGKGVITTHVDRYVVQNDVMGEDLVRYHGIDAERVVVTGWPQTDVFHRRRPREAYERLLHGFGLEPARPLVMVMGNTPTNAPYESRLVERVVQWWKDDGRRDQFSLLFRPHPRDRDWQARFAAATGVAGACVQVPSYSDLDVLATLLQHGSAVVSNAGTILLDSLVNDRPAVCVLYDEGAPAGEAWASHNVLGEHYRQMMESTAFYRAHDFAEVTGSIERALTHPEELAAERQRVAHEVVGEVDGHAADRVARAVLEVVGRR